MKSSRKRVMLKAFFTQEFLDTLSPHDREMMEALMAADTREKLNAVIKRLCDEAEKRPLKLLS
jgi:hypothetical protein